MPVMISRSGRWPWRTTRCRPVSVLRSACFAKNSATSASTAWVSSARAPPRRISVRQSVKAPGWANSMTLLSDTAYHSFVGEVGASNTTTIRRLIPSPRHQLLAIARPALVDGVAKEPVEALVIPPSRLRDLLVEEAELGERIMRALILRRVRLLRSGTGGPMIVGGADNADVLRLRGFLDRNGHPHQRLDPNSDACAGALIERFHVTSRELPIVLCPNGAMLRNPTEVELARCIGMVASLDPDRVYDVAIVGAGPAGLAAAVYAASEGCRRWSWTVAHLADRPALRHASKTILAFQLASPARL